MTHSPRRLVVLAVAGLLLAMFVVLAVASARADLAHGWAGFGFQAAVPEDVPIPLAMSVLTSCAARSESPLQRVLVRQAKPGRSC